MNDRNHFELTLSDKEIKKYKEICHEVTWVSTMDEVVHVDTYALPSLNEGKMHAAFMLAKTGAAFIDIGCSRNPDPIGSKPYRSVTRFFKDGICKVIEK